MFDELITRVAVYAAAASICLGLGAYGGYRFELSRYEALQLADAEAQVKAVELAKAIQSGEDQIKITAASAETLSQQFISQVETKTLTEVDQYVPKNVVLVQGHDACIPWGFVRLLDASVLGLDPSSLQLPAGAADDQCSPVDAVTLARNISSNYATAGANAEQLNRLEATILQLDKASTYR